MTKTKIKKKKKIIKREKPSPPKVSFPGNTLAAFELIETDLGSLEGKEGFEVYQCYRDFFINMISKPEKLQLFATKMSQFDIIDDFQLFDPAYLDNFMLCSIIKIKVPEIYEEEKRKIDKYVRPKKRNEGFNHFYQECGGLLALLLQHYEGISSRQALRAAAQFT